MRELLGGKGANIAEMARLGPPIKVPAGFTVTTEACIVYLAGSGCPTPALEGQIDAALAELEREAGKRLCGVFARRGSASGIAKAGQPGLEPGIAGFGDRCLSQLGHCPEADHASRAAAEIAARQLHKTGCGRRDLNPHGPKPTRT